MSRCDPHSLSRRSCVSVKAKTEGKISSGQPVYFRDTTWCVCTTHNSVWTLPKLVESCLWKHHYLTGDDCCNISGRPTGKICDWFFCCCCFGGIYGLYLYGYLESYNQSCNYPELTSENPRTDLWPAVHSIVLLIPSCTLTSLQLHCIIWFCLNCFI